MTKQAKAPAAYTAIVRSGAASLFLTIGAAACQTTSGAQLTVIETTPPGARVNVEGYGECVAPCSIEHDAPRRVTIAKVGFRKQTIVINPGDRRVRIDLELAAPSGEVVADDLPPLR